MKSYIVNLLLTDESGNQLKDENGARVTTQVTTLWGGTVDSLRKFYQEGLCAGESVGNIYLSVIENYHVCTGFNGVLILKNDSKRGSRAWVISEKGEVLRNAYCGQTGSPSKHALAKLKEIYA